MDELGDDLNFIEAANSLCLLIKMKRLIHTCFCFSLDRHRRGRQRPVILQ